MTGDEKRVLAARKKIRRAASLAKEASRELAQAFDCDVYASAHVRTPQDVARCVAMIQLALDRAPGPVDVTVTAPIGAAPNTNPATPPVGGQEETHAHTRR